MLRTGIASSVKELLLSIPEDNPDDSTRGCIASLMQDYGRIDGQSFVEEFIRRRADLGAAPAFPEPLVSPPSFPVPCL